MQKKTNGSVKDKMSETYLSITTMCPPFSVIQILTSS